MTSRPSKHIMAIALWITIKWHFNCELFITIFASVRDLDGMFSQMNFKHVFGGGEESEQAAISRESETN